jgi:hypothetical protein
MYVTKILGVIIFSLFIFDLSHFTNQLLDLSGLLLTYVESI